MTIIGLLAMLAIAVQAPGHPAPVLRKAVTQHQASMAMGRCALRNNRDGAEALVLATDAVQLEKARRRVQPTLVTCLAGAGSATLNMQGLRGGIAEALVAEREGRLLTAARSAAVTVPVRVEAADEDLGATAVMACTVGAAPAVAVELLQAEAESAQEAAAFRKMVPALQQCVPASGAVRIKPRHVRGLTAVALYQRMAGAASSASPRL